MTWTLTIGNKAYSSWSLRPWILMRHMNIPFEEQVVPLYQPTTSIEIQRHSPTGRVPALAADGLLVWESLSIIEFLAEQFPDKGIWPENKAARAMARSLASEMHAGYAAFRKACPTNFRRPRRALEISADARADVDRIEAAWASARDQWGAGGPFLFGAFSGADAMFAPVVNRFETYAVAVTPATRAYMDAIQALPSWQEWIAGAHAEPWVNPTYDAI